MRELFRLSAAYALKFWLFALLTLGAGEAMSGGSNSGVAPGTRTLAGSIAEWPVPTPKFAGDPAIGSDGNVYFAVMLGDKIARFEPKSKRFQEWTVPTGFHPRGLLVARDGKVYFGGVGSALGELDPATGKIKLYKTPSTDGDPYTLIFDAEDNIWFTEKQAGKLGKLDRSSGKITEYAIGDDPYGASFDQRGNVWVTRRAAGRLSKFDPATGEITELLLAKGSQPRRIALAPDGMLWVTLYGLGRLAKIDPAANKVVKEYELPGGPNAGPYAVNTDAGGRIWVSEIQTDNVIVLNPQSETIRAFKLPTKDTGVREAAIDAEGRYWYIGTASGRLGVIE